MSKFMKALNFIFAFFAIFSFAFFLFMSNVSIEDFSFDDRDYQEFCRGWTASSQTIDSHLTELPCSEDVPAGEELVLKKILPEELPENYSLFLSGDRQDFEVYVNDELRAFFSNEGQRVVGHSSPAASVFVPLIKEDAGKTVIIVVRTGIKEKSGHFNKVYLGKDISILLMLLKTHIGSILCALVIFIFGLFCFVGAGVIKTIFDQTTTLVYLGWFSITSSVWIISRSFIRQIYVKDVALYANMGYTCLMLLPAAVMLLENRVQKNRYQHLYSIAIAISLVDYVAQNLIQMFGGPDFFEMQPVVLAVIVFAILFLIYGFARDIREGRSSEVVFSLIGFGALALAAVVEIFYKAIQVSVGEGTFTSFGILLFIIFNILENLVNIFSIEQQKSNAISASNAKSQFLATMSHEIRTPINAVLGMNELILRECREETITEYSKNIASAGRTLLSLVNDILDFSKIESGKMDIINGDYHTADMIAAVNQMVRQRAESAGLQLYFHIDEKLHKSYYGDEVRIKQVLTNILTNAIKYTKEGQVDVTVRLDYVAEDYGVIYFEVKDTGIGMKPEDLKALGESFKRLEEDKNRSIEGTGLGMAITKNLLHLMDSELDVSSVYGEGSTFSFVLRQRIVDSEPVGKITMEISEKFGGSSSNFICPEACVLIVDDNPMNLAVAKGLLKDTGIKIDLAESGFKCIELVKKKYYDIVFMDHMMPQMSGIEALAKIKEMQDFPCEKSKYIALTANAISGAREMYLEKGFDDYLTKPIEIKALRECILKYVPKELIKPAAAADNTDTGSKNQNIAEENRQPLTNSDIDGFLGLENCGGDFDNYIEILSIYYKQGCNNLKELVQKPEKLFATEDLKSFNIQVHSLKSTSLTLGMKGLSEMAKALEYASRDGDTRYIEENEATCRRLYEKLLKDIGEYLLQKGYIKQEAATGERAYDPELYSKLEKARDALEDFEYDLAVEIINDILG